MQILLFTALLCSSDVVAAVSIVDYTQQPKLYSCIFGEGVFNDIVSIAIAFALVLRIPYALTENPLTCSDGSADCL